MAKKKDAAPAVAETQVEETQVEETQAEGGYHRTQVVILKTSLGDGELGAFSPGDEYPCDEGTANRLIERNMAKAKK